MRRRRDRDLTLNGVSRNIHGTDHAVAAQSLPRRAARVTTNVTTGQGGEGVEGGRLRYVPMTMREARGGLIPAQAAEVLRHRDLARSGSLGAWRHSERRLSRGHHFPVERLIAAENFTSYWTVLLMRPSWIGLSVNRRPAMRFASAVEGSNRVADSNIMPITVSGE